jgi:hypothetical protein
MTSRSKMMYEVIGLVGSKILSLYKDVWKDHMITARIDSDVFRHAFAVF